MTTSITDLQAHPRTPAGKGEARRLRRAGKVPAVAYGKGLPATALSVAPKDVLLILNSERGKNSVLSMDIEGNKKLLVMIRDYTYHPIVRTLEHVDFVEVQLDQAVEVEVPLVGLGKPVGVAEGGILRQVYRTIPVRCTPDLIPVKLEVDVSHLALGMAVATRDLNLPEGVVTRLPAEQTLIAVVAPEKEKVEAVEEGAVVAGAAAVPGAAVPAAGAAAAVPAKDAKGDKKDEKKK